MFHTRLFIATIALTALASTAALAAGATVGKISPSTYEACGIALVAAPDGAVGLAIPTKDGIIICSTNTVMVATVSDDDGLSVSYTGLAPAVKTGGPIPDGTILHKAPSGTFVGAPKVIPLF